MFLACEIYYKQLKIEKKNWGYLIRYGHTEALLKKMTLNGHFSRPAQTDPYIYVGDRNSGSPRYLH